MLVQASLSGLYTPINYSEKTTPYCGIDVTVNPYFVKTYNWLAPEANP
jgi:hypothetical protein